MRRKLATYVLAGAVGLTGAALVAPAVSSAATGDTAPPEGRVASLKDALTGLVSDGTLTQEQADRVAKTLAEERPPGPGRHGRGGRGLHLEALAPLGITAGEVRAAAEAGRTLAQLAQEQGVGEQQVVSALVGAAEQRLADAVADGRLTQAEADERAAALEARIAERMDQPLRHGRRHHERRGEGS